MWCQAMDDTSASMSASTMEDLRKGIMLGALRG